MTNKILVLDAGHGYNTSGKRTKASLGKVYREWTINNSVCKYIAEELKNYNVTIYRTDDTSGATDVSLTSRVSKTNKYKPDLFVSIHHNAGGGTGTEVYWHTKGTTEDKKVANIIAPKLATATGLKNRGVKQASFTVLTCNYTAILIEGGFMDTATDYKVITSTTGRKAYAKAVAQGVIEYLGLTKKTTSSTTSYKVKITTDVLNIRSGAGTNYKIVGTVKKNEVYTIVQTSNNWGKLKSGLGWINLNYTKRV